MIFDLVPFFKDADYMHKSKVKIGKALSLEGGLKEEGMESGTVAQETMPSKPRIETTPSGSDVSSTHSSPAAEGAPKAPPASDYPVP